MKNFEKDVKDFIRLSKYFGQRFDLVQACGGSSSVKLDDGTILVKAARCSLSEIEMDGGWVRLDLQKLKDVFTDSKILNSKSKQVSAELAAQIIEMAVVENGGLKPDSETLMHALLGKYVLHLHPILINVLSAFNIKEILESLSSKIHVVGYHTPGLDTACCMKTICDKAKRQDDFSVFVFCNHGIVVSADSVSEIIVQTEKLLKKLEKILNLDFGLYRNCNLISDLINKIDGGTKVAHLLKGVSAIWSTEDLVKIFKGKLPCSPDQFMYCGFEPLELHDLFDEKPVQSYFKQFGQTPRVIFYNNDVYTVGQNIRKAKGVEDVFRSSLLAEAFSEGRIKSLLRDELMILQN
jgi:rhamnose utilization protein RhaD (predicted bifunctional aldolase and dehydrogenase)